MSAEGQATVQGNTNLKKQDLSQLDITKLTPLSPEVISRQATINIGTIGHVAHGKSTVVKAVSGVHTVRFKNELERNITIKLERLSDELISELTSSPQRLREFIYEEEQKNYKKQTRRKRKLSSINHHRKYLASTLESEIKRYKICTFLDINYSAPDDDTVSTSTTTDCPSSNKITRDLDYSDIDSDNLPIEIYMQRLQTLHVLCHQKTNTGSKLETTKSQPKRYKKIFQDEYVVSKIVQMNVENKKPCFEVVWQGYSNDQNTWEPVEHIYDCKAYKDFMKNELRKHKIELERLWNERMAILVAEPIEINLTDSEAINQINNFDFNEFQSNFFLLNLLVLAGDKTKSYQAIDQLVMSHLKLMQYYFKRLEQLLLIKDWQKEINVADKSSNLRVENIVDFESPPADFTYVNDVIAGENVTIPDDPPIGCECVDDEGGVCSKKSQCCPKTFESEFAYNSKRAVNVPQGTPIFECNRRCKCGPDCVNRVVQQGRKHSLCIFKTSNGCGWGVRTDRAIQKGQFICEYVGEVITYEEAEKRGKIYDAQGRTYLFDLDFNDKDNPYSIDAAKSGNLSHFINHSCDPNLGVWAVWTDCLDLNLPKLCLFALRRIEAGEEITFDYSNPKNIPDQDTIEDDVLQVNLTNDEIDLSQDDNEQSAQKQTIIGENATEAIQNAKSPEKCVLPTATAASPVRSSSESFKCKCGAANCRKVLFL